jgi:glycosyltransferase involved in cell wall biosynthesis
MNSATASPRVSVFMPVYNAEHYLNESIDSILNQSYTDYEFVIVNDGSTDRSAEVIKAYTDPRIRFIENQQNMGLIASLNIGLETCTGEYIVRMDQDDFSLPHRIEKQVRFMDENPEYGLIGCWFEDFGENIESKVVRYSSDDTHIRIRHLYQTHIAHPTAVLRKSVIDKFNLRFDASFVHGEDYAFWVQMSAYCKLSNYPEMLVRKRDHPRNITNQFASTMQATCAKVKQKQFHQMGLDLNTDDVNLYTRFADSEWNFDSDEMKTLTQLLERIQSANEKSSFIPKDAYGQYLSSKFFHLCYNNKSIGKQGWEMFFASSLSKKYKISLSEKAKFRVKSILA